MQKLYIGNLSYDTTEADLTGLARAYSPRASAQLIVDKMSGRSKGFGFVSVSNRVARRFIAAYNQTELHGRSLTVNRALPMEPRLPRRRFHAPPDPFAPLDWGQAAQTEPIATLAVSRHILEVSDRVSGTLVSYFTRHPEEMRSMDHRLFEELIAECWIKFGYDVELTKQTRDGGIDVIAIRRAEADTRFLIQCKRLGIGKKVSIEPVRELLGIKHDRGASKAIIATTVYFTSEAKMLLDRYQWEMEGRDFDGVLAWLQRASAHQPT